MFYKWLWWQIEAATDFCNLDLVQKIRVIATHLRSDSLFVGVVMKNQD